MAKPEKLLEELTRHLDAGETVELWLMGAYVKNKLTRSGIFAATQRRLLFYGKKLGGYDLESFPYKNISSFEQSKGFNGSKVKFFASGNEVEMKWLPEDKLAELAAIITERSGQSAPPAVTAPASSEDVFESLRKLGELRDAGVVTPDEFETKKAELLKRI